MARKTRKLSNRLPNRKSVVTVPRQVSQIGRNEPCPCGSGKKYKACHQSEGEAFLRKLAEQEEKERLKEVRRDLRRQGVPWYRRLLVR